MSVFSSRIVSLRKQAGLSQVVLSEKMGISRSALSMYELGQREPDFETLESFADWFNVDVDYLLGKKDQYSGYSLEEKQLIFMYRKASEDDRAIIKSALSKYGCIK